MLKGAHSWVADGLGESWQNAASVPWAARCGLGDLLSGYIAGLGAMGISASHNCDGELLALGMFLHSEAACRSMMASSASSIGKTLEKMTLSVQASKCCFAHTE